MPRTTGQAGTSAMAASSSGVPTVSWSRPRRASPPVSPAASASQTTRPAAVREIQPRAPRRAMPRGRGSAAGRPVRAVGSRPTAPSGAVWLSSTALPPERLLRVVAFPHGGLPPAAHHHRAPAAPPLSCENHNPSRRRSTRWVSIHPSGDHAAGGSHPVGRDGGRVPASPSGTRMDFVLSRLETTGEQQPGGVRGLGDEEGQLLALGGGEVLEHEVRRVLAAGRAADADADPEVVLGAGRPGDRPQAVVAALAAAALEPDGGEGEVELVVDDDEVGGVHVVVVQQAADRAAGLVHVRRRPGEDDAPAGQPSLTGERAGPGALAGGELETGAGGQLLEHHDPDVVPVAGVARAGIAEPDDQERPFGHDDGGAGGAGAPSGRAVGQRGPQLSADFSAESIDSPLPWSRGSGTTSPSPVPAAASADSSRSMPAS